MASLEPTWRFRASHTYYLAQKVDLLKCLDEVSKTAPNTSHLHVYCDELINDVTVGGDTLKLTIPEGVKLGRLSIFCRKLYASLGGPKVIAIPQSSLILRIVFGVAPKGLSVQDGSGKSIEVIKDTDEDVEKIVSDIANHLQDPSMIEPGSIRGSTNAGVEFKISNPKFSMKILTQVPGSEIDEYHMKALTGEGIESHDSLYNLMNWLFSYASALIFKGDTGEKDAIEALEFIQLCAYNSTRCSQLYSSSQELLTRLTIPRRYPAVLSDGEAKSNFYVPVLNVEANLNDLESFRKSWEDIENTASNLEDFAKIDKESRRATRVILESVSKTGLPMIPTDLNESDVLDCLNDVEDKRKDLKEVNDKANKAEVAFRQGIDKYKKDKESELVWTCVVEGVKVAISLGVAIYTCGAGAPVTLLNVKEAVEKVPKALKAWEKVWNAVQKMIDTLSSVLPKLWGAFGTYSKQAAIDKDTRTSNREAVMKRKEDIMKGSNFPQAVSTPVDYFGIMADWEEFKVDIDEMFIQIDSVTGGPETIKGASEFRSALRKVAIRGQAVLETQRKLYDSSNIYYRGLREASIREARCAEISKAVKDKFEEKEDSRLLMASFLRLDLVNIKRDIFLQFHSCLLSLAYLSTSTRLEDLHISPDISLVAFSKCVLEFRKSWNKARSKLSSTQTSPKDIVFSTKDSENIGTVFPNRWSEILQSDLRIDYKIPASTSQLSGFYHVRIEDMYLSLGGLKSTKIPETEVPKRLRSFEYRLRFGPQIVDKSSNESSIQYWIPPFYLSKAGKNGKWKDPLNDYVKPALFCHGTVYLDRGYLEKEGWELQSAGSVELTFKCQVISTSQPL